MLIITMELNDETRTTILNAAKIGMPWKLIARLLKSSISDLDKLAPSASLRFLRGKTNS
jgi:hypothetical protein